MATAVAEVGMAVVASTEAVLVVDFTGEASAVALSVGGVSATVVSMAVAFVVAGLVGTITDSLMMSSSAASAFRGRGAGAIRTDITATAIIRTVIMDTSDRAGRFACTTASDNRIAKRRIVTNYPRIG